MSCQQNVIQLLQKKNIEIGEERALKKYVELHFNPTDFKLMVISCTERKKTFIENLYKFQF